MNPETLTVIGSVAFGLAVGLGVNPLIDGLNRLNRRFFADLEARMAELGMDTSALPAHATARWVLTAAVVLGVAVGAQMIPVGLMLGAMTFNFYGAWMLSRVDSYCSRVRDQLVIAARSFSNQVRAGMSPVNGLEMTAKEVPAPLGPLLQRVVQAVKQARPMEDALTELKDRMKLDGVTVFTMAIIIANRRGGKLSLVLDRLSHSLEEMQRVERKKESDTASGRLVVALLSAFPFGFLGFYYMLDPDSTGLLFELVIGQVVLSAVGLVVYLSMRWANSILKSVE